MQAESIIMNSSSRDTRLWTLAHGVNKSQGLRFAIELLNLTIDKRAAVEKFCKAFSDFVPWEDTGRNELKMIEARSVLGRLYLLRENLSVAWRMPTAWDRQLALALPLGVAVNDFHTRLEERPKLDNFKPSPANVLAAAKRIGVMLQVMDSARNLHYCGNPECPAPYFLAKKSSQRFCSEVCAQGAQREAKRNWWNEHGSARRKAKRRR